MATVTVTVTNTNETQSMRSTLRAAKYMLGFIFRHKNGKLYALLSAVSSILNIAASMVLVLLPGMIVNELNGGRRIEILAFLVGVITLTPVVNQLLGRVLAAKTYQIKLQLNALFTMEFDSRCVMMDLATLENPDNQIRIDRVYGTVGSSLSLIDRLNNILAATLSLAAIFSIVATINVLIIVIALGIIFINSRITKRLNQRQYMNSKALSGFDHFFNGFMLVLHHVMYAKEVRLFQLKGYFSDMIMEKKRSANRLHMQDQREQLNSRILFAFTNFVQQVILYIYLIYRVLSDSLSVGSMLIYVSAVAQFAGAFNNLVNGYLDLSKYSLNIQEMMEFMSIPLKQERAGAIEPKPGKDFVIEFRDVSFRYPGSERYAVEHLNLTIRGGEKLCVVGENGSGKTTFIKLLTRLYTPTEGGIFLNGVNIEEYDYEKYQRLFSAVFQDYELFFLSIWENIVLGEAYDEERLRKVISQCGLESLVNKVHKGYDTQLYKFLSEDGFEPSGGESQRLAIARACYHSGEIVILDEPTAALDPNAEYEIYTQFSNMITDKCAIFITHRLSAAWLAHKVAVFRDGRVVEYGTHKELYESGGLYTEMFDKQARFYRDEPDKCELT